MCGHQHAGCFWSLLQAALHSGPQGLANPLTASKEQPLQSQSSTQGHRSLPAEQGGMQRSRRQQLHSHEGTEGEEEKQAAEAPEHQRSLRRISAPSVPSTCSLSRNGPQEQGAWGAAGLCPPAHSAAEPRGTLGWAAWLWTRLAHHFLRFEEQMDLVTPPPSGDSVWGVWRGTGYGVKE